MGRGTIYDKSMIKQQLAEANRDYEGRKTWEGLYGTIDTGKQQQMATIERDYSNAVAEAYSAAQQNSMDIMSSNLGQGYKQEALLDNNAALEKAFEAYKNKYLDTVGGVEEQVGAARDEVTKLLDRQAKYTTEFVNAPYQYLSYIFDKYSGEENNIFATDPLWQRYVNKDAEGNMSLKTWDEIAGVMGAKDTGSGEYSGMFDESGNLTVKGVDFYDQMINQGAYDSSIESFDSWLAQEKNELRDWLFEYNPYDYNVKGNNYGSVTEYVGAEDQKYSFIERFGGMNKDQVNSLFDGARSTLENIANTMNEDGDLTKAASSFSKLTEDLTKVTDRMGITQDVNKMLEDEVGMNLNELTNSFVDALSRLPSNSQITAESITEALSSVFVGAGLGAKLGAAAGPGGSIAGGVIGFFISAVTAGTAIGKKDVDRKQQNKDTVNDLRNQYMNIIASFSRFAEEKRLNILNDFNS